MFLCGNAELVGTLVIVVEIVFGCGWPMDEKLVIF